MIGAAFVVQKPRSTETSSVGVPRLRFGLVWDRWIRYAAVLTVLAAIITALPQPSAAGEQPSARRKIVLIAGTLDAGHPKGTHEYEQTVRLLKYYLDHSTSAERVLVEVHVGGWPEQPATLEDADTIVVVSNGSDRHEQDHPLLVDDRLDVIERQMKRGCGLILLHWSTFLPNKHADRSLEWVGGYFDYESGSGPNKWYSKIQTHTTRPKPATPDHPINRGLTPFELREEYYYNIRFRPDDPRLVKVLTTPIPGEPEEQTVAWAVERAEGGRGFAFTGGHFFDNWGLEPFRRMVLNAILWTAHVEVPADGVQPAPAIEPAPEPDDAAPIHAAIVTGHQYPGHPWRETTLALEDALRKDPRMKVESIPDIEILADEKLAEYDLLVLNYCNWMRPGLSDEAKANFVRYLKEGGGLVIIHFANGAFHFSLPEAGDSDWPEYRKICRRVWDHTPGKSGHDAYGPFTVDILPVDHPITRGMPAFETTDELYFRQQGDEPIEVLATARSKGTGHDEPMAFVYEYGKGRVFQTVLGHDAPALQSPGTADLIRRACAWVAGRTQRAVESKAEDPVPEADRPKFGRAFDARLGHAVVAARAEYSKLPFTVECWARIDNPAPFNVLMANHTKESADHWEIYTYAGGGDFSVYLPGYSPAEIRSGVNIVDRRWHYLAMTFDGHEAALYVDGKQVHRAAVKPAGGGEPKGELWLGGYPPQGIGCEGEIDEVRLSRGIRTIDSVPTKPFDSDDATIGLWHLDDDPGKDRRVEFLDSSPTDNPARTVELQRAVTGRPPPGDHFEGFRESDVADDRANHMDSGNFASGSIRAPDGITMKGIAIRLGDKREAAMCFDTELLRFSAGWTGGFIRYSPTRFGLIEQPEIAGEVRFTSPGIPGWSHDESFADPRKNGLGPLPESWGRYEGLYRNGRRVVLEYTIGGTRVRESPWIESAADLMAFSRTLEIEPSTIDMTMLVGAADTRAALVGPTHGCHLERADPGVMLLRVPKHRKAIALKLVVASATSDERQFAALAAAAAPATGLDELIAPGPRQWTAAIVTRGQWAEDTAPYVIDTLTLPYDNPYQALLFASGLDFFSHGGAALCTVHGDVWLVDGIDEQLKRLTWQRFATGLFQPLGLKIVNDEVYVVGRDQVTLLEDGNGDGEADFYRNFNNQGQVTANGHEYVTCLETDAEGNFYFLKGDSGGKSDHDGCLLRLDPQGRQLEIFATGFRNANGLSIGPDGTITVAPQEGNWTPTSAIFVATEGGFYGMMDVHHRPTPPEDYTPPLCWIPRPFDNSSGGQTWVTGDRFGPLDGQLLHLSFGRSMLMLVLREQVAGMHQGGVVPLAGPFLSGAIRARFRPQDGQLYVAGLNGWVTNASRDGSLQRVRYTGRKVHLPVGMNVLANGIRLTFSEPLDRATAEDTERYSIERWNYRRSADYGSQEWSVADPGKPAHDKVRVRSATLLADDRAVLLEIDDMRPVMQMQIRYSIYAADGTPLAHTISHTIHALSSERIDPAPPASSPSVGGLAQIDEEHLRPGLAWTIRQGAGTKLLEDSRSTRLAVLNVADGEAPSTFLKPGPFAATAHGYLLADLRGDVRFRLQGSGLASIWINEKLVLAGEGDLSRIEATSATLRKGYNRLRIECVPRPDEPADFALVWSGDDFGEEPLPPHVLFHDGRNPQLASAGRLRRGRELFATHGCACCHALPESIAAGSPMLEMNLLPPDLAGVRSRLNADWMHQWLLDPRALVPGARMPRLFNSLDATDRQRAADIVAYLSMLDSELSDAAVTEAGETEIKRGEALFENLGCIGCHTLTPSAEEDSWNRMSLAHVGAKFRGNALNEYLLAPRSHHDGTRMPDFKLDDTESNALAAFLLSETSDNVEGVEHGIRQPGKANLLPAADELAAADAGRGEKLFAEVGCGACHSTDPTKRLAEPVEKNVLGATSTKGCLSADENPARRAPRFSFDAEEREALTDFLATDGGSLTRDVPAEAAQRLVRSLDCAACHGRDRDFGRLAEIVSEEGTQGMPPDRIPSLTWTGEKLQPDWSRRLLSGELPYRPRPWLRARMPSFPAFAGVLSQGLAAQHGTWADEAPTVAAGLVDAGYELSLKERGLDCRRCHSLSGETIQVEHNAQGVALAFAAERLRYGFFRRWMMDPLRIDPATKMPRFSADRRTTMAPEILGGNAAHQFDAIWCYLGSLRAAAH